VLFKELTDFFQCAVVEATKKPAVADTKLRFIECESIEEAYFLCGLLNSSPAMLFLYATATWVQTADYQASDISRLRLPRFAKANKLHAQIAHCSKECHNLVAEGHQSKLQEMESKLDEASAQIWGITDEELKVVQHSLADFGFLPNHGDLQENDE
jgi:hypothetical protein